MFSAFLRPDSFFSRRFFMQRHMQNISFITILGVLLSCSFIFSQLTNVGTQDGVMTDTPVVGDETIEDLPICTDDMADEAKYACYAKGVEISSKLLEVKKDKLLALEPESDQRMAIMEAQIAWEESRDADCHLILVMREADQQNQIEEMICLRDLNLARIQKLDEYLCEWYGATACSKDDASFGSSD